MEFSGEALESHRWIPACTVQTQEKLHPQLGSCWNLGIIPAADFHVIDVNDSNC